MSDEKEQHEERVSVSLGDLSVTVAGNDAEEVEDRFSDVWDKVLKDAEELSQDAHRAVRGWQ